MVEMAPGGRPTVAARARLVLDGLRERFLLPTRRRPLAVLGAMPALVIGGALGAAGGSRAGMWTYAPAPPPTALGAFEGATTTHDRFSSSVSGSLPAGRTATELARQTAARFTATGWTVEPPTALAEYDSVVFRATSGGVRAEFAAFDGPTHSFIVAAESRTTTAYAILVFLGTALGGAAGWLFAAALAHRIAATRHPRIAAAFAAVGIALLALPTTSILEILIGQLRYPATFGTGATIHQALHTGAYLTTKLGFANGDNVDAVFATAGAATLLLAFAATARQRPHQVRPA